MRWAGHELHIRKRRGEFRVLVGKPEGKEPLGRSRIRWEYDIEWILKKLDAGTDWIRE
jgi:hypothetical protein